MLGCLPGGSASHWWRACPCIQPVLRCNTEEHGHERTDDRRQGSEESSQRGRTRRAHACDGLQGPGVTNVCSVGGTTVGHGGCSERLDPKASVGRWRAEPSKSRSSGWPSVRPPGQDWASQLSHCSALCYSRQFCTLSELSPPLQSTPLLLLPMAPSHRGLNPGWAAVSHSQALSPHTAPCPSDHIRPQR